jgi:ribose transport system substrate-binding protein
LTSVAYFDIGSANNFGAVTNTGAKSFAKSHPDIKVTIFDGNLNPQTQFDQIQSALQSGKYKAISVTPVDGSLECQLLSQQAPEKHVVVSVVDQPICGRYTNADQSQLWQPGTLNYLGGFFTKAIICDWYAAIGKQYPGHQVVGTLQGPAELGLSQVGSSCLASFKKSNPGYDFVSLLRTAYTSATAYQQTQNMIQANPNLTLITADDSDETVGAARAIAQAGKTGQIHIADFGGQAEVVPLIKSGVVGLSGVTNPQAPVVQSLDSLADAVAGKKVARVSELPFQIITKANVDSYHPVY